jgi:hypothetical protein
MEELRIVLRVFLKCDEKDFGLFDKNHNLLADGFVNTTYKNETDSYIINSVDVYDCFFSIDEKKIEKYVEDNIVIGSDRSFLIELTKDELDDYDSKFGEYII